MKPSENLRVAAIQMTSTGDVRANVDRARDHLKAGIDAGARLLCLPENFAYLDREGEKIHFVESIEDGPGLEMTRRIAGDYNVFVAAGTVPLAAQAPGRVTNTIILWGPDGNPAARYDKLHLFDIALDADHDFRESRTISAGSRVVSARVDGWSIGLSICYDLRFPELYRALSAGGADAFLIPSAFTARTGKDHWELLLRARAIENLAYVIAPGQWGRHNARRESWGQTLIVDPWGLPMRELPTGEGVVVADLDRSVLEDVRRRLPALGHRRIPVGSAPD